MAVKVTITWIYILFLLLNAKCNSNFWYLLLYRICPERIVVSIIEFTCTDNVPWYLETILVSNLLHWILHLGNHFIFLLQIEWGPP